MIWKFLVLAFIFIAGGMYFFTPAFKHNVEKNPDNPATIAIEAGKNAPIRDIVDSLFGGIFGIFVWFGNWVVTPLVQWIIRFFIPAAVIPSFVGYIILAMIFSFTVIKMSGNANQFVAEKGGLLFAIILGVFLVGIVLTYMKLI